MAGVLLLALVVRLLVSDWPHYRGAPPLSDAVQFAALFATLCGYAVIWRREGLGALLATGGASCFLVVGYAGYGSMPPSFALLYLPGVLAAICWWLTGARAQVSPVRTLRKRPIVLTVVVVELVAGILVGLCFLREATRREGFVTSIFGLEYRPWVLGGPVPLSGEALRRHLEIQPRHAQECEIWAKAVEADPRDAKAYYNWGMALRKLGRHAEACEKYAKAVEINPQDATAYASWGVALAGMGKRAEAEEKWNEAVKLNPELKPQIEEIRKQLPGKE